MHNIYAKYDIYLSIFQIDQIPFYGGMTCFLTQENQEMSYVDSTWSQTLAKYGESGLLENVFSAVRNGVISGINVNTLSQGGQKSISLKSVV